MFNKCPIYIHDGASAKFSTNSHETDYSVSTDQQETYQRATFSTRHFNLAEISKNLL
jgi:hypothetical protein